MKLKLLVFIFLSHLSLALAETDDLCWTKEENSATKQPYSSFNEWDNDVFEWKRKYHAQFNLVLLVKAFSAYSKERAKASSFGNDKIAHCYIGCRIAQRTDFRTSRFAAWYKEFKDITDCNMDTHFETKDYEATLLGAEAGRNKKTNCELVCPSLIEKL
ncbi:MAG: hypothetical protein JNM24_13030 [Bdellovibrionaceae bacterium]|nr:hypothetical protein [Pseudobdellovibrionaceae bacterium]